MFKELMMGFDCREMWMPEAEVKNWTDKSWLLNPDIERVMTVNRVFWRSVFLPPSGKYSLAAQSNTAPGYNLAIPDDHEYYTINTFWRDLDTMRTFMGDHKEEYQKRCWVIGITIVQTPEYLRVLVPGGMRVPPTEEQEPDPQWTLLGYDVEDSSFFNGGLGMNWIEEYQSERRKLWGHRLNQYYLFSRQEVPLNMRLGILPLAQGMADYSFLAYTLSKKFPKGACAFAHVRGEGLEAEVIKSIRLLSEIADDGRKMLQVMGIERKVQTLTDRRNETVHHANAVTEFIGHLLLHCPIQIVWSQINHIEAFHKSSSLNAFDFSGATAYDFHPDDRRNA